MLQEEEVTGERVLHGIKPEQVSFFFFFYSFHEKDGGCHGGQEYPMGWDPRDPKRVST